MLQTVLTKVATYHNMRKNFGGCPFQESTTNYRFDQNQRLKCFLQFSELSGLEIAVRFCLYNRWDKISTGVGVHQQIGDRKLGILPNCLLRSFLQFLGHPNSKSRSVCTCEIYWRDLYFRPFGLAFPFLHLIQFVKLFYVVPCFLPSPCACFDLQIFSVFSSSSCCICFEQ